MNKMNKKGFFELTKETIKWPIYFIILVAEILLIVSMVNVHVNRNIDSEDIEFFLTLEHVKRSLLKDEIELSSEDLKRIHEKKVDLENLKEYGIQIQAGEDKYYIHKETHDEKSFCKFRQYDCQEYKQAYLVDGKYTLVHFDMVRHYETE